MRAELYVSSSAKDTDFIVRVSDVYPDEGAMLIIDYVRRVDIAKHMSAKR